MMTQSIQSENDIYLAVSKIKYIMKDLPFSDIDIQSVIVSLMETTRNVLDHGGGFGKVTCSRITDGICFTVTDQGPGIPDIDTVLSGNYQSEKGLGLGLSGTKRLMDVLQIQSTSKGTKIIAIKRYT